MASQVCRTGGTLQRSGEEPVGLNRVWGHLLPHRPAVILKFPTTQDWLYVDSGMSASLSAHRAPPSGLCDDLTIGHYASLCSPFLFFWFVLKFLSCLF